MVSNEFRELERLRSLARHNEASALRHAAEVEREKWQFVVTDLRDTVADKYAENEQLRAQIVELQARLGEKK
jgi:ubiquinone biosynthesis protein UbiJ